MNKAWLAVPLLAYGIAVAENRTGTFEGVITDAMCKNNHAMMKVSPDAKCVRECVKGGSKYALLEGGNVYPFSDQSTPARFAGQRVRIKGTLYERTKILKADSIEVLRK